MRLRYDLLETTLGDDLPDEAGPSTITFAAALTAADGEIATIAAPDYLPLTIRDPDNLADSEIVYLIAYTSGAITGTISRGEEGSTASAHSSGAKVENNPTRADFPVVLTQAEYDALDPPDPDTVYLILASSLTPQFDAYIAAALDLTPWGLWPIQEDSGSSIADVSGNSRHGTIDGAVVLNQVGPLDGVSAEFTGGSPATAGIELPGTIDLTGSWSLVAWVRQTAPGDQQYLVGSSNVISSGNTYWSVNNRNANAFCVQSRTGGTTTFAPSSDDKIPADSAWHLAAVTRSGSTLSFYIDGVLSHTGTNPTVPAGVTNLAIGMLVTSVDSSFTGRMAGVVLYESALSAGEISDLYDAGTA